MLLLQWEQGVFLQSVPYLASVPDRPSQCGEPASLTIKNVDWKQIDLFTAGYSILSPQLGPSSEQGR
jgi:hypothetical protein